MTPANKRIDQSFFQTGIGAGAYATLVTEQLISLPGLLLLIPLPFSKVMMVV